MTTTSEDHAMADRQVARYRMLYHHDRDSYLRRTCGKPAVVHFVRRYRRPESDPRLWEVAVKIIWPAGVVAQYELTIMAALPESGSVYPVDPSEFISELAVAAGAAQHLVQILVTRFSRMLGSGKLPGFCYPTSSDKAILALWPGGFLAGQDTTLPLENLLDA